MAITFLAFLDRYLLSKTLPPLWEMARWINFGLIRCPDGSQISRMVGSRILKNQDFLELFWTEAALESTRVDSKHSAFDSSRDVDTFYAKVFSIEPSSLHDRVPASLGIFGIFDDFGDVPNV